VTFNFTRGVIALGGVDSVGFKTIGLPEHRLFDANVTWESFQELVKGEQVSEV